VTATAAHRRWAAAFARADKAETAARHVDNAAKELRLAAACIAAVLELHRPKRSDRDDGLTDCVHCGFDWPCPTAAELGVEE